LEELKFQGSGDNSLIMIISFVVLCLSFKSHLSQSYCLSMSKKVFNWVEARLTRANHLCRKKFCTDTHSALTQARLWILYSKFY